MTDPCVEAVAPDKPCPFCGEVLRLMPNTTMGGGILMHTFVEGRHCPCDGRNFTREHWNSRAAMHSSRPDGLELCSHGGTCADNLIEHDGAFCVHPITALKGEIERLRGHFEALDKAATDNIVETDQPDRMRWEGVWYDGPPATAFLSLLRAVQKVARQALTPEKGKGKVCAHGVRHPWQCDDCDRENPMPEGWKPHDRPANQV